MTRRNNLGKRGAPIGAGDFGQAYSYFGPAYQGTPGEESWNYGEEEESYEITGSTSTL